LAGGGYIKRACSTFQKAFSEKLSRQVILRCFFEGLCGIYTGRLVEKQLFEKLFKKAYDKELTIG